jgi:hypothetical protein
MKNKLTKLLAIAIFSISLNAFSLTPLDPVITDLCINRNNHQKPTFLPLGDFLNPALVLLGQGLKKSPIGQKLDFANHPYLCKGLTVLKIKPSNNS